MSSLVSLRASGRRGTGARLLFRTILFFALAAIALAQTDRGTIAGTVTDPSSAVISGAKVVIRNLDNGNTFNATSSSTGGFTITSVPSGKYSIAVSAPGFKAWATTGIDVRLDSTSKVDVTLEVGNATETVTVTAAAEVLKTDNAEISMNVSGDKVNDLPINFGGGGAAGGGIRNWLSFTYLAPGVAGTSANSEVNGLPGSNFKVYLEGQDSTSNNDTAWTSTVAAASVEAITEFAVQSSNFSAEYGQVMGGLYNFTTKSGTNQLHGSVYEEWANEVLDARHPFNHLLDRDRKNDYGFTIGGPVYIPKVYNGKNHTFFFFNLERFANNQAASAQTGTVPTAAYRNGDFSCALYVTIHQLHRPDGDPYRSHQRISIPAKSDLRSEQHLHRRQRPAGAHRVPQQCNPHQPARPGGAQGAGPDPGAGRKPRPR